MSLFYWKFMCGKCKVCIGPSDTISIRWGLCNYCKEILPDYEIKRWIKNIAREHGVCH